MKKRDFLKAGAGAAAALAALPVEAQQSGPTYTWKMATGWASGPLMDIGAKAFAERMAQLSGGRFKIQTFPGGALGNALRVPETVKNGVAECGHTWMGYDWGKDPTTVLFGGYAGSMDSERMLHWMYDAGGDKMQREYREEKEGVISFPLFIRTAEAFLHSRKPVRTLADLRASSCAPRARGSRWRRTWARHRSPPRAATSIRCSSAARSTRPSGARSGRTSRPDSTRSRST